MTGAPTIFFGPQVWRECSVVGGHIKIYSEIGQGSTVKIYLPRLHGKRTDEEEPPEEAVVGAEDNETVLLVEDDADLRSYLADLLRGLEYNIIAVAGAVAALDLLAKSRRKIDLLLTDIVMPGDNGRELANAAQQLRPGMQVLFMTGYSRNAVAHQGRLDEGVDLLQKPISQAQLASRVRAALDRKPQESS